MNHGDDHERHGRWGFQLRGDDLLTRGGVDGRIRRILVRCVDIPAQQITGSARLLADLEMDALDFVEVALELEREFALAVAGDGLARLETVDDLVDLVCGLSMMPTRGETLHA